MPEFPSVPEFPTVEEIDEAIDTVIKARQSAADQLKSDTLSGSSTTQQHKPTQAIGEFRDALVALDSISQRCADHALNGNSEEEATRAARDHFVRRLLEAGLFGSFASYCKKHGFDEMAAKATKDANVLDGYPPHLALQQTAKTFDSYFPPTSRGLE